MTALLAPRLIAIFLVSVLAGAGFAYVRHLHAGLAQARSDLKASQAQSAALDEAARKMKRQVQALDAAEARANLAHEADVAAIFAAPDTCLSAHLPADLLEGR